MKLRRFAIAFYLTVTNGVAALLFFLGVKFTRSGMRHANIENLRESVGYIQKTFQDYLDVTGLSEKDLAGKTVLEVGPGDNLGVALLFLCHGARQVFCLDKFYSIRKSGHQKKIYLALRDSLSQEKKKIFNAVLRFEGNEFICDSQKLNVVYGIDIGVADCFFSGVTFDFIVSRAVLEHVGDPSGAFVAMDKILKVGGFLAHKIDFRDHGLFSARGLHPLTFLTFSEFAYRGMSAAAGRPSRILLKECFENVPKNKYERKFYVTHYLGESEDVTEKKIDAEKPFEPNAKSLSLIREIRAQLAPSFRERTDGELSVTGVFLAARKKS